MDNKTSTKLYDKQDSFPFEIGSMPFFNSNVPSKTFDCSIGSEIPRLARNSSGHLTFIVLVNKLLDIMSKQGSQKRYINSY